jgi:hypothetical protein
MIYKERAVVGRKLANLTQTQQAVASTPVP